MEKLLQDNPEAPAVHNDVMEAPYACKFAFPCFKKNDAHQSIFLQMKSFGSVCFFDVIDQSKLAGSIQMSQIFFFNGDRPFF
ncbi:hypothetical protein DJ88_4421 [Bacillus paralicheniformis]|nr:hypothetical protein DJ88_4421 [Bacillus paralicheniformis]